MIPARLLSHPKGEEFWSHLQQALERLRSLGFEPEEDIVRLLPALALKENAPLDPDAVGAFGEVGYMQVGVPALQDIGIHLGLDLNPFDPVENLMAGYLYLHLLRHVYRLPYEDLPRGYNAGPRARWDPLISAAYAGDVWRIYAELWGGQP